MWWRTVAMEMRSSAAIACREPAGHALDDLCLPFGEWWHASHRPPKERNEMDGSGSIDSTISRESPSASRRRRRSAATRASASPAGCGPRRPASPCSSPRSSAARGARRAHALALHERLEEMRRLGEVLVVLEDLDHPEPFRLELHRDVGRERGVVADLGAAEPREPRDDLVADVAEDAVVVDDVPLSRADEARAGATRCTARDRSSRARASCRAGSRRTARS
jgi:hypothetical protein